MKTNVFVSGSVSELLLGCLARSGIDVTVAEKDAAPSVKYRGERLQSKSPGIMNRLDLYKEVQAAGFSVQTTSITEYKDSRIKGEIQYQCERINYLLSEVLMIPS